MNAEFAKQFTIAMNVINKLSSETRDCVINKILALKNTNENISTAAFTVAVVKHDFPYMWKQEEIKNA